MIESKGIPCSNEALLSALAVGLILYYCLNRRNPKKNYPPGPTGLPLVGYISFLGLNPHETYVKLAKKYGPVITVQIATRNWVILNDYDVIQEAFVRKGDVFSGRPHLHMINKICHGYGVIFRGYSDYWKEQRKFGITTLRGFGVGKRRMEDQILEEIGYLSEVISSKNENPFNLQHVLSAAVSNVTCNIIKGSRFSYDDERFSELIAQFNKGFSGDRYSRLFALMIIAPGLRFLPFFRAVYNDVLHDVDIVIGLLRNVVQEQKATFDSNDIRGFIDAFIQKMNNSKEDENSSVELHTEQDLQLLRYVRDLFGAGTETTTSTLRWCLLCFLHHPKYQHRIYDEILRVIGESGIPSMTHKDQMPFTCAFIHEIMRHRTIAPLAFPHETTKNTTLRGYDIPKGTAVMANLYAAHHDSNVFDNPHEFRPERFLDDEGQFVPSNHVIPFSVGPRYCLGEQLARMEIFLFLTGIVQKFQVFADPARSLPAFEDGVFGFGYTPMQYGIIFKNR